MRLLGRELSHGAVMQSAISIGELFPRVALPHSKFKLQEGKSI